MVKFRKVHKFNTAYVDTNIAFSLGLLLRCLDVEYIVSAA